MKRQPMLCDRILALRPIKPNYVAASWKDQTLDWVRLAKRFVLDEKAASYLGTMIDRHPRIIADAMDFAVQPYENMVVEMPCDPFYEAVTGSSDNNDGTRDRRQAFVFNRGRVRVLAEGHDNSVGILPVEYRMNVPMNEGDEQLLADAMNVSRLGLDFWLWGYTARKFIGGRTAARESEADETWDKASLRAMRHTHSARLAPTIMDARTAFEKMPQASGGDLRNAVAILLFINRTSNITLQEGLPTVEGFVGNKLRPLLSHRVIRLKLDPLPRLARLCAGLGIKRRLHDVRGHFCHDRVAREEGCPHGQEHEGDFGDWWEEYEPLRWRCSGCGGKRWWRAEHKRGHSEVGAVLQEYEVTR